jgi:hypothetical protein
MNWRKAVKPILNRPWLCALVTGTATLLLGAWLVHRANFGMAPPVAFLTLTFLFTIGLPAILGVAGVAAMWGHLPPLVGFSLFAPCAAVVALLLQYGAFRLLQRVLRSRPGWRRET